MNRSDVTDLFRNKRSITKRFENFLGTEVTSATIDFYEV
jgi:hypothetical protein